MEDGSLSDDSSSSEERNDSFDSSLNIESEKRPVLVQKWNSRNKRASSFTTKIRRSENLLDGWFKRLKSNILMVFNKPILEIWRYQLSRNDK